VNAGSKGARPVVLPNREISRNAYLSPLFIDLITLAVRDTAGIGFSSPEVLLFYRSIRNLNFQSKRIMDMAALVGVVTYEWAIVAKEYFPWIFYIDGKDFLSMVRYLVFLNRKQRIVNSASTSKVKNSIPRTIVMTSNTFPADITIQDNKWIEFNIEGGNTISDFYRYFSSQFED
jgi:hypothetical protein